MAVRKMSASSIRNGIWYRSMNAANVFGAPNYGIRLSNVNRANAGVAGAYVDTNGDIYFSASNNNGGSDGGQIMQKISSTNTVLWSYTYGNAYGGEIGMRVDSSGNLYTGGFHGNSPGDYYLLVIKYSPSGTIQWQRWFGGSVTYPDWTDTNATGHTALSGGAFTDGRFVLLDTNGNTVFTRSGNLGGESGEGGYIAGIGPSRAFFGHRKRFNVFDLNGTFQFGRSVQRSVPRGIFDSNNNLYLTQANHNDTVVDVTKFDPTGTVLWERRITAPSGELQNGSQGAVDSQGNFIIPMTWYQTAATSSTGRMTWVSFDTNGNVRYQRMADTSGSRDVANQLNINESLNLGIIGGWLNGQQGGIVTFDIRNGSPVPRSASLGGVTVSTSDPGFTISTPSALTYGTVADIGGSTSVSTPSRGSSGGSGQYSFARADFA